MLASLDGDQPWLDGMAQMPRCPEPIVVRALAALRHVLLDLLRPVYVRDVSINLFGRITDENPARGRGVAPAHLAGCDEGGRVNPYFQRQDVAIYHCDNRELKLGVVELLLADPQYGISYRSTHNSFYRPPRGGWDAAVRTAGDFAPIHGDDKPFDPAPFLDYPRVALFGGNYYADKLPPAKCWIVWDKKLGQSDDGADCEFVWTNFPKPARIFPHLWRGICRAGEANVANGPKLHPNQKPVELLRRIIKYSDTQGLIYDSHMGSGSTLCAAFDLDRPVAGCDIEERWCEIAAKRLEVRERRAPLFEAQVATAG